MGHYDNCREAAEWCEAKDKAYDYYARELNQLGSAVELIKAIANGYGTESSRSVLGTNSTPAQACDRWLMDNGYDCEATRAAQKAKKLAEIEARIAKLEKEKEELG